MKRRKWREEEENGKRITSRKKYQKGKSREEGIKKERERRKGKELKRRRKGRIAGRNEHLAT